MPHDPKRTAGSRELTEPEYLRFLSNFPNYITTYIPDSAPGDVVYHSKSKPEPVVYKAKGYGVFFSVNGFKGSVRQATELTNLNGFFADLDYPQDMEDGNIPHAERVAEYKRGVMEDVIGDAMETGSILPTFIVETKNGYHLYWLFADPIFLGTIVDAEGKPDDTRRQNLLTKYSRVQSAIIERYSGDPNAKDVCRVLRVPGTYHIKQPNDPFLCKLVFDKPGNKYSFKQLADYFLTADIMPSSRFEDFVDATKPRDPQTFETATGYSKEIPPDIINDLDILYPKMERPSMKSLARTTGIPKGERNNSLFIVASSMRQSGMTEADVAATFPTYNGLTPYEIKQTIRSAFKRPVPADFGWYHPLIQKHVTAEEKAKVRGIIAGEMLARKLLKEEEAAAPSLNKPAEKPTKQLSGEQKSMMQTAMFQEYEFILAERYPLLKYIENLGFCRYQGGAYEMMTEEDVKVMVLREMTKDGLLKYKTTGQVKNILDRLMAVEGCRIPTSSVDADPDLIVVQNGIVDIRTGKLSPHTPDYISQNKLPVSFHPDGSVEKMAPNWLRFLSRITKEDPGKIRLLQQMTGYILTTHTKYQKAFILYGTGANGKSTFVETIQHMLGPKNFSTLTFDNIHRQFGIADLYAKRLNIIEEISNNYFESDMFKKLVSGSVITADRKFREPLSFQPYAKFVFAVNSIPKIRDTSFGLYRRLIIVPFSSVITDPDPGFGDILAKEVDGIFLWALKGLFDLTKTGYFVETKEIRDMLDLFKEQNSPLVEFLLETYDVETEKSKIKGSKIPLSTLYDEYVAYCSKNGYSRKSRSMFMSELDCMTHPVLVHVKVFRDGKDSFVTKLIPKSPFGLKLS